jgi:MYXO-CTERM domain-containing protein
MSLPLLLTLAVVGQPTLEVPWTCGVTVMCTQDHNGGSHVDYGAWAWDFDLDEGDDVLAAASGTVEAVRMDSNTGGCDSSYANDANYVVLDHGDGTAALYLHMQQWSSSLSVGDWVPTGTVVGRIGLTGWVCGDHLHFQVQSVCGSWWCQSMPAEFYTYGDPAYGDHLTSDNCGGGGDTCEADLAGGETLVSESDGACFHRVSEWWWDVSEGHDGHHYYTYATDEAQEETVGEWHFGVSVAGDYEVLAHVPDTEADSQSVSYQIHHADGVSSAGLNHATDKGWQSLGVYRFAGGDDERIHLGDNTGEDYDTYHRKIAFDAIKFVWDAGGDDDDDVSDDDDAADDDDTGPGDDDDSAPGDDDADPGDDDTHFDPGPVDDHSWDSGCGCSATGSPHATFTGLFLLLFFGALRRRGRPR